MTNIYRIIIADDHHLVSSGIKNIIEDHRLGEVIATVANGKELLLKLNEISTDCIILDINMPHLDGIETAKFVLQRFPFITILIVSQYENKELVYKLKQMGVKGYLPKTFDQNTLLEALEILKNGGEFFPLLLELKKTKQTNPYNLTTREIEIIKLISNGMSSKDIAMSLSLSEYTINTHRKNIAAKTNTKTIGALFHLARELGILYQ